MSQHQVEQRGRFAEGDSAREIDYRASLQAIREDIDSLRQDVRGLASDAATAGRDAVRTGAACARESGRRAAEAAQRAQDTASDYVSDHPMQSMLIAAGLGALVGGLLMRKR